MFIPITVAQNYLVMYVESPFVHVRILIYSLHNFPPKIIHSVLFTRNEY